MRIDRDTVVTLACEVRDCDGEPVEEDGTLVTYLHGGYGGIFAKIENELQGKEVGHEVNLTLEPEDAFGDYDAELLRVEPVERYGAGVAIGMEVEEDSRFYTVTDVAAGKVVLDGNHPLAGMALRFSLEIVTVRSANDKIGRAHV